MCIRLGVAFQARIILHDASWSYFAAVRVSDSVGRCVCAGVFVFAVSHFEASLISRASCHPPFFPRPHSLPAAPRIVRSAWVDPDVEQPTTGRGPSLSCIATFPVCRDATGGCFQQKHSSSGAHFLPPGAKWRSVRYSGDRRLGWIKRRKSRVNWEGHRLADVTRRHQLENEGAAHAGGAPPVFSGAQCSYHPGVRRARRRLLSCPYTALVLTLCQTRRQETTLVIPILAGQRFPT